MNCARRFIFTFTVLLFSATIVFAQTKVSGPSTAIKPGFDRETQLNNIFARFRSATNETQSRIVTGDMWHVFMMAPDAETANDMNHALQAIREFNMERALSILNKMVVRHPSFAEAWNQRAYVHFLKREFPKSLENCEKVLELEPRHIGCLTGMARILIQHLGRPQAGVRQLKKAVALNPWLRERELLQLVPTTDL